MGCEWIGRWYVPNSHCPTNVGIKTAIAYIFVKELGLRFVESGSFFSRAIVETPGPVSDWVFLLFFSCFFCLWASLSGGQTAHWSLLNPYQSSFEVATFSTKRKHCLGARCFATGWFLSYNPQSETQLRWESFFLWNKYFWASMRRTV